jgi:hypothetical protein
MRAHIEESRRPRSLRVFEVAFVVFTVVVFTAVAFTKAMEASSILRYLAVAADTASSACHFKIPKDGMLKLKSRITKSGGDEVVELLHGQQPDAPVPPIPPSVVVFVWLVTVQVDVFGRVVRTVRVAVVRVDVVCVADVLVLKVEVVVKVEVFVSVNVVVSVSVSVVEVSDTEVVVKEVVDVVLNEVTVVQSCCPPVMSQVILVTENSQSKVTTVVTSFSCCVIVTHGLAGAAFVSAAKTENVGSVSAAVGAFSISRYVSVEDTESLKLVAFDEREGVIIQLSSTRKNRERLTPLHESL